jgi:hypothetical protein
MRTAEIAMAVTANLAAIALENGPLERLLDYWLACPVGNETAFTYGGFAAEATFRLTIQHACGNDATMTEHVLGALADADVLHGLQRTVRDAVDVVTSSAYQAGMATL